MGECRGFVYTSCKCVPHAEAQYVHQFDPPGSAWSSFREKLKRKPLLPTTSGIVVLDYSKELSLWHSSLSMARGHVPCFKLNRICEPFLTCAYRQRSRSSLRKGSKHPNEQPQGTRRCSKHTHRSLQSIPKVRPTRRRTMSRCCNQPLHNEGQLPTGSNTQAESGRGIRDRNRRPEEGY